MALFKILRGQSADLDNQPFHDGYAYFTPDDGRFYIDVQSDIEPDYYYSNGKENGKDVYRIEIESKTWSELNTTKSSVGHMHYMQDIQDAGPNGPRYGTCDTAAATAAKVATINDGGSNTFSLKTGAFVLIKMKNTNTVASPTLNVNGTGAKSIRRYGTTTPGTNANTSWIAGSVRGFVYDGTYWQLLDFALTGNDNQVPASLCVTAAGTAAKTASHTYYAANVNSYTLVTMRYANTATEALTLNINSQGAKPIYINGVASSANNHTLPAGTYLVYYDGTNYYFRTDGKITGSITGDAATVGGFNVATDVPGNAKFTDTTYTFDSATGLTTSGTKIAIGTVPVTHGGTGTTSLTVGQVLVGNGTNAVTTLGIDTTKGGTANSASLITSGAVYAELADKSTIGHGHTASDITDLDSVMASAQELFIVNVTLSNFVSGTSEKSSTEIYNALIAGKLPVVKINYGSASMMATLVNIMPTDPAGDYVAIFVYEDQTDATDNLQYGRLSIIGTNVTINWKEGYVNHNHDGVYAPIEHNHDDVYATKADMNALVAATDAMTFKGTLGTGGTITAVPANHTVGDTYKVITASTWAGQKCEVGDLLICITTSTAANNAHWTVAQTNIDGAVTGPTSATASNFAAFNGTSGKIIQDSGYGPDDFSLSGHNHDGAYAPIEHGHGNISSTGTVTTTATLSTSDKILFTDTSNNNKVTAADMSAATSTLLNSLSEGTSPAQMNDYFITQYAGGGTTTITYHRRKLSNILNTTNTKTALGIPTAPGTNAIIYATGTATASALAYKATASGALYSTGTNSALAFGTLPIAQGGTGATSAASARTNLGLGTLATKSTIADHEYVRPSGTTTMTQSVELNFDTVITGVTDGQIPQFGEVIPADDITAWHTNVPTAVTPNTVVTDVTFNSVVTGVTFGNTTVTSATVSGKTLHLTLGAAGSITSGVSGSKTTGASASVTPGTAANLEYTGKNIPNVINAGSMPTFTTTTVEITQPTFTVDTETATLSHTINS